MNKSKQKLNLYIKRFKLLTAKQQNKKFVIMISAVIFVLLLVFIILLKTLSTVNPEEIKNEDKILENTVVTYSTNTPDETIPPEDYKWYGYQEDPMKIKIDSIGVDSFIQKVGVDQNNEIAVPNNVHIAGWFVNTVKPGEKGLSVIDGHVDGLESGGIFRNLDSLKSGDEFTIIQGSGNELNYKVLEIVSVATDKAVSVLFSQNPSVISQLNLITCGGTWNEETQQYSNRIIVRAELI